ncbi:hypothetical protein GE061_019992 [Apolygus lucorum]|uniref:SFR19-like C-terminal domain-containing protein n=1 Tax=Apolygus lucorum TaxID=248454 RepID=A0A8S9XC15_APOLU|nr:hypothetical protein GE061_019992 [Apolygus lucorum]
MSLQRTEQVEDMEEDPPIDEFVQQIYDTFQEETDAYGTISKEHVTTPEPCNAPEKTLAGIVDCIRYAANGHSYMTRAANSQAAIVAMLKVTRWIPQYQRIALERDRLLERREKWRTERAKLLKERAEAWKEIQELKRRIGLQSVEPPAAKATNDSSKVRPQSLDRHPRADTPATSESLDESPTRPRATPRKTPKSESPKQSTSRARSPTPELRPRQSPTRLISPFQTVVKSPPPKARRGSESSSTSPSEGIEEESYLPKNMEEPQVETRTSTSSNKSVPKLILKKCWARHFFSPPKMNLDTYSRTCMRFKVKKSDGDPKYLPLQPPPSIPLLPPPEPPSKLYEDDDFDLYADIETPTPSKLAPPPEPPALLFALDGDDKDENGGEGSDEETGLVIDDRNDAYDPEMPTSPPSPTPSEVDGEEKKSEEQMRKAKSDDLSSIPYPALEDIPPPPSPPPNHRDKDNDSDSECPNQGLYSKLSMQIAKGKSDSDNSDKEDEALPPPPVPPFGSLDLSSGPEKASQSDEQEVPDDLGMSKCAVTDSKDAESIADVEKGDDGASVHSENENAPVDDCNIEAKMKEICDGGESPLDTISKETGERESPKTEKKAVRESELSEGELEDESSDKEPMEVEDLKEEDKAKDKSLSEAVSSEDLPLQSSESDKPLSESDGRGSRKRSSYRDDSLNGSVESLPSVGKSDIDNGKNTKSRSNVERENDGEPDLLELGCEEERDGLVDITDEEISNYERSWEMEDNGKQGKSAGLEGLETEAISDCEYPPGEGDKQDKAENSRPSETVENGNKEEEGEIVTEERVPVQWKKLSKTSKERSYRGDKEVKTKEKNKEITTKKKEKRKELERYDVRKLISEKPRRKVDEFGRDISSNSRSNSRSLSRGRRSLSRSKKKRSKSRSRSKERTKERARSRERAKERSRERSRSKDKARKDRSKEKRSRSRSKKRRRSRSPRKERGRSREKGDRDRKKRKKSPSLSCSSCSCSSCEREKRRSNKKLTVIVTNEEVVGKRGRDKGKTKNKEKKGSSPKSRRRNSPVPSKEVFTSGDNILVSVNFKSSKGGEGSRSKESASSSKRKKDEGESRKKKDKGTKENQPVRSIVTTNKKSNKKKLNTKNMKPVAIIDLEASPFRETIVSPKEVIILTDSDSEDKLPQVDNAMSVPMTGPKTPPEPLIKFNIVNNKQQQLRTMANPLLDSLMEQLEGEEGDDEPNEIMHKGPNTPPEPPVPYDPFEPTKSRSPTPGPDAEVDRHMSPLPDASQRHTPQQAQTPQTPPKLPQHVAPKTPSPLHSPPKAVDDLPDKPKLQPFQPAGMDSDNDSGGGGGGGDSPYSPGSSEGDDLFEPPMPQPGPGPKSKARSLPLPALTTKHAAPAKDSVKKRQNKSHKESSKKASSKKEIGIKLDEDQLKILDELPNSAVEMQVKDKFLKKLNRQERVVEEVKMVLKPHYAKKHVTKEEYKEILRKSVPKICHSRSGEINPMKIQRLIEAYVKKYRHKSKKRGGAPAIPPLRQNKGKTMWC